MTCNCYSKPIRHKLPDGKTYCPGCGKTDKLPDVRLAGAARQAEGWDGGTLAKLIGPCSPLPDTGNKWGCGCACHLPTAWTTRPVMCLGCVISHTDSIT